MSGLATAAFCASAEDGDQLYFETKISECDEIIHECNKTIQNFEKEKDRDIESVNNALKTLAEIKKMLASGQILECDSQGLEIQNQDFLKQIKDITENYQKNIKSACEIIQQQINQKAEFEKKLADLKKLNKNSFDLVKQIQSFREKYMNSSSNRDENLTSDIMNFENKVDKMYQDGGLSEENISKLKKEFEDLKAKSSAPDQSETNFVLWQKINSGSQRYESDHVADNLCWLHSATNVLNYYNNMKNGKTFKGQKAMVQQYKAIMGDQATKDNVNGNMKEFGQIAEYLEKCKLGSFQIVISSSSKDAKQKIKDIAKELLKAHFNAAQNKSPVIAHTGGKYGHFVTITDCDENKDKFLVVDSSADKSIEANISWIESEKFLDAMIELDPALKSHLLEMDFTSRTSKQLSIGLNVDENNSIVQKDFTIQRNEEEIQTSIDVLKDMIKYY